MLFSFTARTPIARHVMAWVVCRPSMFCTDAFEHNGQSPVYSACTSEEFSQLSFLEQKNVMASVVIDAASNGIPESSLRWNSIYIGRRGAVATTAKIDGVGRVNPDEYNIEENSNLRRSFARVLSQLPFKKLVGENSWEHLTQMGSGTIKYQQNWEGFAMYVTQGYGGGSYCHMAGNNHFDPCHDNDDLLTLLSHPVFADFLKDLQVSDEKDLLHRLGAKTLKWLSKRISKKMWQKLTGGIGAGTYQMDDDGFMFSWSAGGHGGFRQFGNSRAYQFHHDL